MESKDLLKEELARIKSQSEDERLRIINQMKERESEFFEQLKSEKKLREQFLKDQVEHNLIALAEDTQRLSPVPPTASGSVIMNEIEALGMQKDTGSSEDRVNHEAEEFKLEVMRLESELKISNGTCEKLRRDVEKLKDAYVRLKQELTDERSRQSHLKQGNEGFLKEINKLQSDINNIIDENETLLTEKNNIIKAISDKVAAKESEIDALKKSNDEKVKEISEKMSSELNLLSSQVTELTDALNEKTAECSSLETVVKEVGDKLALLRQEYKESTLKSDSKCKGLKELADTARKRSDELTTIKFDLEKKLNDSLNMVEDERKKNNSLLDEMTRLKCEMNEMKLKHDEILHALHELGREHSTLQVQGEKLKSKKWVDDESVKECTRCSKPFSVTTRKHHCRSCFNIFCSDCSPLRRSDGSVSSPALGSAASLFKGSVAGGTRICEGCFSQSSSK